MVDENNTSMLGLSVSQTLKPSLKTVGAEKLNAAATQRFALDGEIEAAIETLQVDRVSRSRRVDHFSFDASSFHPSRSDRSSWDTILGNGNARLCNPSRSRDRNPSENTPIRPRTCFLYRSESWVPELQADVRFYYPLSLLEDFYLTPHRKVFVHWKRRNWHCYLETARGLLCTTFVSIHISLKRMCVFGRTS